MTHEDRGTLGRMMDSVDQIRMKLEQNPARDSKTAEDIWRLAFRLEQLARQYQEGRIYA